MSCTNVEMNCILFKLTLSFILRFYSLKVEYVGGGWYGENIRIKSRFIIVNSKI